MCNLSNPFGTTNKTEQTQQQSSSVTNPLAGTILQYGQSNVFPQFSASNIANTSAQLGPNQYQTGAANNQAGVSQSILPVFNSAANMATTGISPASIQQWMSPYTQSVIDATNRQADVNDGRTLAQAQGSSALTGGLTNSAARGNMDYLRANLANNRNAMAANQYNTAYNTALDSAFKNAGVMNTGAGTAGNLAGVQTTANMGAGNLGELIRSATQTSALAPYNLTTQGASTLSGLVPGVGSSSTGTGTSSGTTDQSQGWGTIGAGLLGSYFMGRRAAGGSVFPRFDGHDREMPDRLSSTVQALRGMFRSEGGAIRRYEGGGFVSPENNDPALPAGIPAFAGTTSIAPAAESPFPAYGPPSPAMPSYAGAADRPQSGGFMDTLSSFLPSYDHGVWKGEKATPNQRFGMALTQIGMNNPFAGFGKAAFDQSNKEVERTLQEKLTRERMALEALQSAGYARVGEETVPTVASKQAQETARHNKAMEEQGKWAIDPQRGVAFNTRTMETKQLEDETARRAEQATRYGMDPNSSEYKQFVLTGKMGSDALSPIAQKQILEAEEIVRSGASAKDALRTAISLNSKTYEGIGAKERAWFMGNMPEALRPQEAIDTLELNNLVQQQVLDKLKATFGGNPTEGERKILMDVAGSVNLPKENRQRILERALESIEQREAFNKAQIEALRNKTYFKPGQPGTAVNGPAGGPRVDKPVTDRLQAPQEKGPPGTKGNPVYAKTPQDAFALPAGTHYLTPDGREMVR